MNNYPIKLRVSYILILAGGEFDLTYTNPIAVDEFFGLLKVRCWNEKTKQLTWELQAFISIARDKNDQLTWRWLVGTASTHSPAQNSSDVLLMSGSYR